MKLSSRGRGCCVAGSRERGPPPRSPFVHQLRLGPLQKAKIAFMTLTLFPIRLFFAAFMMLLAWPFAFIASMGADEQELEKPLSWWRKIVDVLLKAIMRMMWLAGGFHWINVKGRRALPAEAAILTVAPHSSYFDAIPVTMTFASIVMKAESKDIPVWGTLIKYIRPVFVSRSDQDSRRKTVEEIKRRAQSDDNDIPRRHLHKPILSNYIQAWLEILWLTLCQFHNSVEIENEDGVIDVREFVIALSVVCKPSKTLETIQLAFQLYQSKNGTITEEDLAHILKTAMGVSQINVTHLFRAVDEEEKGKITYDDFYRFAELHPHFAEDYLYPDQMGAEHGLETSSLSAPNGICTDFSPENAEDKNKPLQKKLN
ncbi:Lysophosphatidylcholine acyltransferase 1 isoform X1 [Aix galericulata]|nr:Lysophosphatidylcholine acyltransferase 1 isoform X1 [Aix galericulata]